MMNGLQKQKMSCCRKMSLSIPILFVHLNILKKRGQIKTKKSVEGAITENEIQSLDEIPMQESIDKFTIQVALITLEPELTPVTRPVLLTVALPVVAEAQVMVPSTPKGCRTAFSWMLPVPATVSVSVSVRS